MSNWSCIILTFSGIDGEVKDGSVNYEKNRINTIKDLYNNHEDRISPLSEPTISYSCGDNSTGSALETVAVFHCKLFDPDILSDIISQLEWEYPENVEFFWKDECMQIYYRSGTFKELKVSCL